MDNVLNFYNGIYCILEKKCFMKKCCVENVYILLLIFLRRSYCVEEYRLKIYINNIKYVFDKSFRKFYYNMFYNLWLEY